MDTLRQDLAYAFRVLLRRPGFTLIAGLTLAVGIAANTAIFSLVNAVVLRPLPFPHAERLVALWTSYPASNGQPDIFSPLNYLDVANRVQTFQAVGGFTGSAFTLVGAGDPENIPGAKMTASMALGVSQGEVLRMVMAEALLMSAAGVAVGLAAALALSRFMGTLLFGVEPHDALTYAVVTIAAPVAALLAAYAPARRAMRVDPAVSLRSE
jgi:hypothetical protein